MTLILIGGQLRWGVIHTTQGELEVMNSVPGRPVRLFGGAKTDYGREGEDRTDYRGLQS